MATHRLGIIMHGVTGRMGTNQHLVRSILAIRADGGVALPDGDRVMPDPILVGRNADKLEALARRHGVQRWTTDLAAALADPADEVFFDAGTTQMRPGARPPGDRGRQARLLRKAVRHEPRGCAGDRAARRGARGEERHRAGQALLAGPA